MLVGGRLLDLLAHSAIRPAPTLRADPLSVVREPQALRHARRGHLGVAHGHRLLHEERQHLLLRRAVPSSACEVDEVHGRLRAFEHVSPPGLLKATALACYQP